MYRIAELGAAVVADCTRVFSAAATCCTGGAPSAGAPTRRCTGGWRATAAPTAAGISRTCSAPAVCRHKWQLTVESLSVQESSPPSSSSLSASSSAAAQDRRNASFVIRTSQMSLQTAVWRCVAAQTRNCIVKPSPDSWANTALTP